jgi:hypothetical protein
VSTPASERRYHTVTAFEAALTARLKNRVTAQRTYQDLRKELAFDRILVRLMRVSPDAWLLKGGVALEYRLKEYARATTDIDISARGTLDSIADALQAAAAVKMEDYFAIRIGESNQPVDEIETYRFSIAVLYENGREFERIKIDVGFADPWLGEAQALTGPRLLDFAGIEPAQVRAIPIGQHLAEKIHAYTKRYGSRGSTRVKDLVDMVLLLDAAPIDDFVQADFLGAVFTARSTHPIPHELPPPPAAWRGPYARLADGLPVPASSDAAYAYVVEKLSRSLSLASKTPTS